MTEYSLTELQDWNEKIEKVAKEVGLNYYEQEFEICSYEDMIGYETYIGMPSHYPHWSYGKNYERTKTLHKYNLTGLPYEMVINSDPCLAYLMKDNTLLLQILTIAHVYGHNDFFKNNRLFRDGTYAKSTIEMFKNHANRIRDYISDPGIGYDRVEKILNAAHAIKFQTIRTVGEKTLTEAEKRKALYEKLQKPLSEHPLLEGRKKPEDEQDFAPQLNKIPIEPVDDLIGFIGQYARLADWQRDIISIVKQESQYFMPQIETKIMNEGWASYWHYNILQKLGLEQGLHIEFLKRHNSVIRPHKGQINPYYIGFKIFEDLVKKNPDNPQKIFEVREVERDQSFLRKYLTRELCEELNLFQYVKIGKEYLVKEVSDEEGWKEIRNYLANTVGVNGIPKIKVTEFDPKENSLYLEHEYDGRELELNYAYETLKHVVDLWDGKVMLATHLDEKKKVIMCDEKKRVTLTNL
jgi:stage V sporulation protein R